MLAVAAASTFASTLAGQRQWQARKSSSRQTNNQFIHLVLRPIVSLIGRNGRTARHTNETLTHRSSLARRATLAIVVPMVDGDVGCRCSNCVWRKTGAGTGAAFARLDRRTFCAGFEPDSIARHSNGVAALINRNQFIAAATVGVIWSKHC